jgi:hypothetical protein
MQSGLHACRGATLMRLRAKSGAALALLLVLGLLALAFTVAHDSAPAPAQALPAAAVPMKAVVHRQYGSPDVVKLEQLARPTPKDDELLIRVRAAAIIHSIGTTCAGPRTSCD